MAFNHRKNIEEDRKEIKLFYDLIFYIMNHSFSDFKLFTKTETVCLLVKLPAMKSFHYP